MSNASLKKKCNKKLDGQVKHWMYSDESFHTWIEVNSFSTKREKRISAELDMLTKTYSYIVNDQKRVAAKNLLSASK